MTLQDALTANGIRVQPYSGRRMYGDRCLGVIWDGTVGEFVSAAMFAIQDHIVDNSDKRDIFESFSYMKDDSMGLGLIIYFPNIPYEVD